MKFIALAAVDPQGVIGKEQKLPWYYPEELAHFRASTWGHVMIMGYNTYLSMPGRAFEGRVSVIFTRKHRLEKSENIFQVSSLDELDHFYQKNPQLQEKTQWVIGGGEIFNLFFSRGLIQTAVMTYLKKSYEGDTFFPLHYLENWSQEMIRETRDFSIKRLCIDPMQSRR